MKTTKLLWLCIGLFSLQITAQKLSKEEEKANAPSSISLQELVKNSNSNYVITAEHVSRTSGIHHIYLRQAINGLEVYGTESSVHLDQSGSAIQSHNKFLHDIQATVKSSSIGVNSSQAISSVANQMGYKISDLRELENKGGINQQAVYSKAGISKTEIPVKLMYYYKKDEGTIMVWELSIAEVNSDDWWNFRVDAATGRIIDKENWTLSCNILGDHNAHNHDANSAEIQEVTAKHISNTRFLDYNVPSENNMLVGAYRVYAMPVESPDHGPRSLVTNPDDPIASPFGWHDTNGSTGAESTLTTGNNVDAHKGSARPDGTGALIFDFPIDLTQNPTTNTPPYITNLFYWNNIIHDVLYQYGFDEVSGNFQENNYGNGGSGSDGVNANAQASGNCNANFGTPADGSNPTMNMFLCTNSSPPHDGDLDNMVIVHEYGHGISNRLTGGPSNSGCLSNSEQMGEGWSDYYGLMLTMEAGDVGPDGRGVGTYLFGQPTTGPGIRTFRYSTNFAVNPHTYDDIKTEAVPHGVGSVWAAMLWEMTWEIMASEPFDSNFYTGTGGNNTAIALVTEGLKLQPCSPGFVDGRDAILAADMALYGGIHQCDIWAAFARRGLGFSAIQGSSGSRSDGTEAFDLPPTFSSFDTINEVCLASGVQTGLSGGSPAGGVYSGTGVTDDGNGSTYTFDPSVSGPGLVTISYLVNDFCTGAPTTLTDDIDVTDPAPVIVCRGSGTFPATGSSSTSPGTTIPDNTTITSTITVTENVSITDLDVDMAITHTWTGDITLTLESPSGTQVVIFDDLDGCSGDNINDTYDDESLNTLNCQTTSDAFPLADYQPSNPLSAFDGENTAGTWTLSVTDDANGDTGTLDSWGLNYTYDVVSLPLDVLLDGSGNATILASDLLLSSFVECGGLVITGGSPPATTVSFTTADLGINNVDIIATSDTGVTTMCTAVANVIGGPPCDIAINSVTATSTSCPTTSDGTVTVTSSCTTCTGINYTLTPTSPPGAPIVQLNNGVFVNLMPNSYDVAVEDAALATCNITWISGPIVVSPGVDSTPPTITCPANVTVECGDDTSPTATGSATATDSCDAAPAVTFSDSSVASCGNTEVITRTWTATDASTNSVTCIQTITVVDTTDPVISCGANITMNNDLGTCEAVVTYTAPAASDGCGGVTVTQTAGLSSGSAFPIGTTTNIFEVADDCGNTSNCSFEVTVSDNEDPVVVCPADQTVDPGVGNSYMVPDYIATGDASATDNCTDPLTIFTQDPAPGTLLPDGVYTVIITAEDEYGNIGTCDFELTVDTLLGISDNENLETILLYPNPTANQLMISNSQNLELVSLDIYDISGRLIKTVNLEDMGAEKAVDVSQLASAPYLLIIRGENGVLTKQIIKE